MMRIYTIGMESAAASVLLLPALWAGWELCRRNMTAVRKMMILIFAVYLCAVCSATGLPTSENFRFAPRLNLLPLTDCTKEPVLYILNTLLNALLFIPFGFFVPLLWRQLRSLKRTMVVGFAFSLFIEFSQMFSGRLTDVDDLIVNTLGAAAGYLIARTLYRQIVLRHGLHDQKNYEVNELAGLVLLCTMVMYFVRPLAGMHLGI